MAHFLQDTIEELEVSTKTKKSEKKLKEFANFVQRVSFDVYERSNIILQLFNNKFLLAYIK